MYIGWPVLSMSLTAVRSDCGQPEGEPRDDVAQSCARISAPISPPPSRKSSAPRVGAAVGSADVMPLFPTPARQPLLEIRARVEEGGFSPPRIAGVPGAPLAAVLISRRVAEVAAFLARPRPGLGGAARAAGLD